MITDNSESFTTTLLNPELEAVVAGLSEEFIRKVDFALLSQAKPWWQKVAMLIGLILRAEELRILELPDIFYAGRIRKLVEAGKLEAMGNLDNMRFSEVRLPDRS